MAKSKAGRVKYELDDFEWNLVREALKTHARTVPLQAKECAKLGERLLRNAWEHDLSRRLDEKKA